MDSKLVYLVQTDTTVGFSSSDDEKLSFIKKRPKEQKILKTVDSFKTLNKNTRVPKKFRKNVRNSKKTTFIYPNGDSYRVINKAYSFYDFINKFHILYSTSANETKKNFDIDFSKKHSDIIVENKNSFCESHSSRIIKINKIKKNKIR